MATLIFRLQADQAESGLSVVLALAVCEVSLLTRRWSRSPHGLLLTGPEPTFRHRDRPAVRRRENTASWTGGGRSQLGGLAGEVEGGCGACQAELSEPAPGHSRCRGPP
jgi:hypothetical protein